MSIAARMKQARTLRDMTQPELARAAGVSNGTIGNIEAGTVDNPRHIIEIAAALRVDPEWLLTGSGPMERHPRRAWSIEARELADLCDAELSSSDDRQWLLDFASVAVAMRQRKRRAGDPT